MSLHSEWNNLNLKLKRGLQKVLSSQSCEEWLYSCSRMLTLNSKEAVLTSRASSHEILITHHVWVAFILCVSRKKTLLRGRGGGWRTQMTLFYFDGCCHTWVIQPLRDLSDNMHSVSCPQIKRFLSKKNNSVYTANTTLYFSASCSVKLYFNVSMAACSQWQHYYSIMDVI